MWTLEQKSEWFCILAVYQLYLTQFYVSDVIVKNEQKFWNEILHIKKSSNFYEAFDSCVTELRPSWGVPQEWTCFHLQTLVWTHIRIIHMFFCSGGVFVRFVCICFFVCQTDWLWSLLCYEATAHNDFTAAEPAVLAPPTQTRAFMMENEQHIVWWEGGSVVCGCCCSYKKNTSLIWLILPN